MRNSRQVFISYGREPNYGTPIAQELHDRIYELENPPLKPFLDTSDLNEGDKWRPQLAREIEDSFLLIVLCSQKANGSQYVTFEWSYAMGKQKPILPIEIQKPVSSEDGIANEISPMLLDYNSKQLYDFIEPTEIQWQELINTIVDIYHKTYTPAPVQRAIEFSEHPLDEYRRQALKSLYENEHHTSVDALIHLINNTYIPQVRWEAAQYLAGKGFPKTLTQNNIEARQEFKKKQEVAIVELKNKLWDSGNSYNVISTGVSSTFETALSALNRIGTENVYQELVNHYCEDISTFRKHRKTRIIAQLINANYQKVEPYLVQILKHIDDEDEAPENKEYVLRRLAEHGNIEIIEDISDYVSNKRPDIKNIQYELKKLIEEDMIAYSNFQDILPIFNSILDNYLRENSTFWEIRAKSILRALQNRRSSEAEKFLSDMLQTFTRETSRSGFISEIRKTLDIISN